MCPSRTLQLVRPGFFMFDEKSAKEAKLSWENLELLSRILGELGEKWGWPYFPSVTDDEFSKVELSPHSRRVTVPVVP